MKNTFLISCFILFLFACHEKPDNSAQLKFEENTKTVKAMLEDWQNESMDYSLYSENVVLKETGFNAEKDSISFEEMKENDKRMLENYDFKLLGANFLPGVNAETKLADGSVRYYGDWEITKPATDSTEAKSGVISVYHSFDFDDEGKIVYEQMYADFTGIMKYLWEPEPKMDEGEAEATE